MTKHRLPTLRALAVAACATGLAVTGTSAAQARVLVHTDHTGDVRTADLTGDDSTLLPAPRHHDGDIASVRFSNGTVIGVRANFDDLKPTTGSRYDILKVVTNEHVVRTILVIARPRGTQVLVERANGADVQCHGITHSANDAANVAVVHVPRRCLGDPRWVKMGYIAASVTGNNHHLFIDDALRDRSASFEGTPVLSGKIWRH